jgi:Putative protein-S-isoprenylcysteine methyltransferase
MAKLVAFGLFSIVFIALSRKTLFNVKSHGFYRFLSWECIAWLLVNNLKNWFDNPLCARQLFSWIFLFTGLYLAIAGAVLLKKTGNPAMTRNDDSLYAFEKTTELVDTGIFRYIRHPLYSSLIFLSWGIWLKNPSFQLAPFALISSICLYLTAISDERECINYFGEKYKQYMKHTSRFIPFIF